MAVDKLVDSTQLDADLTSVANAIRTKGGTSGSLVFPAGFVSAVGNIETGGVLTTKTITANGTYDATDDNADGYSQVTVNVSGGGSSSWTKVAETTYQVSTTSSTSSVTVATWATGDNSIWTSEKFVYVRVRDTAGKRAGYFYGSDQFFMNINPANGGTETSVTTGVRYYSRYSTADKFEFGTQTGTNGYGVYADTLYSDGRVRIRSRYSSSLSLTIDGTYKVEVYLLDPAGGVLPFA